MNLAVVQVNEILKNSMLKDIPRFLNYVPEDDQKLKNLPLIRVVEINSYYSDLASNKAQTVTFNVQIDVWTSTLAQANDLYFKIDEVLQENQWACQYSELTNDVDLENCNRIIKRYETIRFK
ncbi:hypothetical protein [Brochothrix campestris]|uniref:Uncharacterized protein n=1 Tax=Brochothrix campestris FSL F6-1037 TaxID=1265861 RepID=W7CBJ1_9LIST|nr:hypothetical protein [Brochothrix campestris]EUJ34272.1 hypothetical protein BCAMP_12401 [Brochothrix campestris FSL F6-1037]